MPDGRDEVGDEQRRGPWRAWWQQQAWPFLHEHHWLLVGLVWLGVCALGCIGAAKELTAAGEARSPLDPLYRALQLFALSDGEVVAGPIRSWELELARFLAPAAAAYTATAAAVTLMSIRVRRMLLRWQHGHIVVCGLGQKGLHLVGDFRRLGRKVVAVELDGENDAVTVCRDLGVTVLVGDATESATLQQARVHAADLVVALTGNDGTNVEVAVRTRKLVEERAAKEAGRGVHCFVHVVDLKLRALFDQHPIFTKGLSSSELNSPFEVTVFNIYENAARSILDRYVLDRQRLAPDDGREMHLAVIGFGQMGESIVVQAARIGHFANRRKLRVTVVDRNAPARAKCFLGRYPQFGKICSVDFLALDADDTELLDHASRWSADQGALTTVVVALDSDTRALSCALGILPRLDASGIPIIVRMAEDAGLAALLRGDAAGSSWLAQVYPFGMPNDTCTASMLLNDKLDTFARAIHDDFVAQRRRDPVPRSESDPSMRPWHQLTPGLKASNRQQADHIPVKLRAIGCHAVAADEAGPSVSEFTHAEIETMAIMEHARWVAERLLGGWSPGPKDTARKQSPYLVGWEALEESIREYDREAVRRIPTLLQLVGQRICRTTASEPVAGAAAGAAS